MWDCFKKYILYALAICMTICQLTPIHVTYALEEDNEEAEVVILGEDESLREESSKTFILSDKSYQKVIYSMPVHYLEDGQWKEIDNRFIDDGIPYVETYEITEDETENDREESITNIEPDESSIRVNDDEASEEINVSQEEVIENEETAVEDESILVEENHQEETPIVEENIEVIANNNDNSQVVGYKNKNGNLDIKFSKKVHQKNMVSIQDDDYKVTWGFKDYENKSYGVVSEGKLLDDPIESAYNHIAQQITYSDVISGIDLVYHIDSLSIKENIVIKEKVGINTFTFEYKVNGLELVLNENGDIEAINENNEVIFLLPKPYMYDHEGNYCLDVHYEITQENKKYTITIVADEQWLNSSDRAYPITIDPVIQTQQTAKAIKSTFIASNYANTNFDTHFELLVGRESSAYYNCRSLFKFTLPTLNRGDMVVDAKFYVAQYYQSFYTSSTPDLQINAHMITKSWTDTNVTWNSIKGSGSADSYYDSTILDYDFIKKTDNQNAANWKVFDVTSAVKQWYNGTENNGILLKSYNESGSNVQVGVKGTFWPEDYNNSYNAFPYLLITYRSNKGLESYYDYTSFSTLDAGNVYIDNYSGNLVIIREDSSTYGSRMPVTISHVYNGYMANRGVQAASPINLGNGWMLNIHQTVKPSTEYGLTGENANLYPYVYMDQDGTEHYFIKKDNKYYDEDGLGLELELYGDGYKISDKKGNKLVFDYNGKLCEVSDVNGNTITILTEEYQPYPYVRSGNGQMLVMHTAIIGDFHRIYEIDEFQGPYIEAGLHTKFDYTGDLLTEITCPDGRKIYYEYDTDCALIKMVSSDGSSIEFEYTSLASGKQVSKVVEKGRDGSVGQTIKFDRSNYNTTIITTSGIDSVIDTSDDVKIELQFDNAGRLVTKRAYTDTKDLGVGLYEYTPANPNEDNSNLESLNKLNKVGSLGKNVNNMLVNHSGETTASWNNSSSIGEATFTFESTSEESLYGNNSLKITTTASEYNARSRFYLDMKTLHMKPNTTYTASMYVKTKNIEPVEGATDYGAALIIWIDAPSMPIDVDPEAADFVSEYIVGTTDEDINNGWRKVSVTFTTPSDVEKVRFNGVIRGATGTAYFDGFQLELGDASHPYNIVINNGFERTSSNAPTIWKKVNLDSEDLTDTTTKISASRSMKITSSVSKEKYLYQAINIEGTEDDTYILSGWSYGKGVDKGNDSTKYELIAKVSYTDGTSVWKDPLKFNTSISEWKYVSQGFDLSDGTSEEKTPESITIYIRSYGQPNTLYFDNIQLIQTEVATCEYDDEGNMISSNGSSYEYENGDLIKVTDKEGKETTYTYNDKHQQTSMTLPNGITTSTTYDEYGNIISVDTSNQSGTLNIKTETVYDQTSSFVSTIIDEDGYETNIEYIKEKGLIDQITDARGNSIDYRYEDKRLTQVTSGNVSVDYGYDEYQFLNEIRTSTDSYYFSYDTFGNKDSIKVNNQLLSSYHYQTNNGNVDYIEYGNGDQISYVYNEYGNVIQIRRNQTLIQENIYNSKGEICKVVDYKENKEYVYEYDHKNRLVRYVVFELTNNPLEDRKVYETGWGYDLKDRVIYESINQNGEVNSKSYSYNENDLLSELKLDENTKVTYQYDGLERITEKVIETSQRDIQTSYEYAASKNRSGYTTEKIEKETIDGKEYTYSYDEIGNITQIVISQQGATNQIIQYQYDANSQLIRENNHQLNKTITYEYDQSGNILTKKEYPYTTSNALGTPANVIDYGYENEGWKNQLTSYNQQSITYDSLGNPISYLGKEMSWEGRELVSINQYTYSYNSEGVRISKTVNGQITTYTYLENQLLHERKGTKDIYYSYDESGKLVKISYNNSNYYIATNMRGDVEGIYNENGQLQARYIYDSWGKVISILDGNNNEITDTNHIGHINPIRYRGYYYDSETGFYYLISRYYDSEIGRFISADTTSVLNDSIGIEYKNLYSYCDNNPITRIDICGTSWSFVVAKFGCYLAYNLTMTFIFNLAHGELPSAMDITSAVVNSAIDSISYSVFVKAFFTVTTTIVDSLHQGDSSGEAIVKSVVVTGFEIVDFEIYLPKSTTKFEDALISMMLYLPKNEAIELTTQFIDSKMNKFQNSLMNYQSESFKNKQYNP